MMKMRLVVLVAAAIVACSPTLARAQAPAPAAVGAESLSPEEQQRRRAKLALEKLIGQIRDAYTAGNYQQVLDLVDEAEKADPDNKTVLMYREWAREKLLAGETGPPRPRFAPRSPADEPSTFPVALPVAGAPPAAAASSTPAATPAAPTPAAAPEPLSAAAPADASADGTSPLLTYILVSVLAIILLGGGVLFAISKMGARRQPPDSLPERPPEKEETERETGMLGTPQPAQAAASSWSGAPSPLATPAPTLGAGGLQTPSTPSSPGSGLLFGASLSAPVYGSAPIAADADSEKQDESIDRSEPGVQAPAAVVAPPQAPVLPTRETAPAAKTIDTISFDFPPVLPQESPAGSAPSKTASATPTRTTETVSFGSLGLVEEDSRVAVPPPPGMPADRNLEIPPAPAISSLNLDDISSLVPRRPEDKPQPSQPATPASAAKALSASPAPAIISLDDLMGRQGASAPPVSATNSTEIKPSVLAPPPAPSPAVISLEDLIESPTAPVPPVTATDTTVTKIPAAAPPPPPPAATIQLSDDTRLPLGVGPADETLHGQETIRLAPSELPPPPARETVVRMDNGLSETQSLSGGGISPAADDTRSAPVVSGSGPGPQTDNKTPAREVEGFYVSTASSGKNVDERSERMFRDQCARAKEAMSKRNFKQAVHYLSIAAAIHPEDEEVRRLLREAREAKRKQEAGT
jgi:hypothetical protein